MTSEPIQPSVVDYYLGLLPGVVASHARRRLHLVSPHDGGPQPLSAKLLERPRLLEQIRVARRRPRSLAPRPVQHDSPRARPGAPARHPDVRARPEVRRVRDEERRAGVLRRGRDRPSGGREGLRSVDDVVDAVLELVSAKPSIEPVVLKHDEGVSGLGTPSSTSAGSTGRAGARRGRLARARPEAPRSSAEEFLERFADGGIVEELIIGTELRSPSVQMRATPLGKVELLSTHDQLLGGVSGQIFLGRSSRRATSTRARSRTRRIKVGERSPDAGVLGRFAVDFLTARHRRRLEAVRDRAEPAQGRHDPPVPDAAVPH